MLTDTTIIINNIYISISIINKLLKGEALKLIMPVFKSQLFLLLGMWVWIPNWSSLSVSSSVILRKKNICWVWDCQIRKVDGNHIEPCLALSGHKDNFEFLETDAQLSFPLCQLPQQESLGQWCRGDTKFYSEKEGFQGLSHCGHDCFSQQPQTAPQAFQDLHWLFSQGNLTHLRELRELPSSVLPRAF